MQIGEGHALTAEAALECASRVLVGVVHPDACKALDLLRGGLREHPSTSAHRRLNSLLRRGPSCARRAAVRERIHAPELVVTLRSVACDAVDRAACFPVQNSFRVPLRLLAQGQHEVRFTLPLEIST
jgi:hypothetical protein